MPPAARVTDLHTCADLAEGGPHALRDEIAEGSASVIVEGRPAARQGDALAHGGRLVTGCPSVLIGGSAQEATLRMAAASAIPFCEECERARARRARLAGPLEEGASSVLIGFHEAARVGDRTRCIDLEADVAAPHAAHEEP